MNIDRAFHKAANISRAELYGMDQDPQMPLNLADDARTPFLGFSGENYKHESIRRTL